MHLTARGDRLTHLVDNSVYARLRLPQIASIVERLVERRIGHCRVLKLEARFSARDPSVERQDLTTLCPLVPTHDADWGRAADVSSGWPRTAVIAPLGSLP